MTVIWGSCRLLVMGSWQRIFASSLNCYNSFVGSRRQIRVLSTYFPPKWRPLLVMYRGSKTAMASGHNYGQNTDTKFQLFIYKLLIYKPACLQKNFHRRVLSIRVFSSDGHYLTIRPEARVNSPRRSRMRYWPVALEGEGSNCFSITQLVGQKRQ